MDLSCSVFKNGRLMGKDGPECHYYCLISENWIFKITGLQCARINQWTGNPTSEDDPDGIEIYV